MTEQGEHDSQVEPKEPKEQEGELRRQTHFPVEEKKQVDSKGYKSKYRWVDRGRGRWELVLNKAED